jgi:hypothetical protein
MRAETAHVVECVGNAPTIGLHVYGGDIFELPRRMWHPQTLRSTGSIGHSMRTSRALLLRLLELQRRRTRRRWPPHSALVSDACVAVLRAFSSASYQRQSGVADSSLSNQNRMPISRYIVLAAARCYRACAGLERCRYTRQSRSPSIRFMKDL